MVSSQSPSDFPSWQHLKQLVTHFLLPEMLTVNGLGVTIPSVFSLLPHWLLLLGLFCYFLHFYLISNCCSAQGSVLGLPFFSFSTHVSLSVTTIAWLLSWKTYESCLCSLFPPHSISHPLTGPAGKTYPNLMACITPTTLALVQATVISCQNTAIISWLASLLPYNQLHAAARESFSNAERILL